MGVSSAGSDVEALQALRDRLAFEIDATDQPQIVALLSRQFIAVVQELAELKPTTPTRVDQIAQKHKAKLRAIRGSDTPDKASSGGKA